MKDLEKVVGLHYTRNLPLDGYLTPRDPRTRDWASLYGVHDGPDFTYTIAWNLTRQKLDHDKLLPNDIVVMVKVKHIFKHMLNFDAIAFTIGGIKLDSRFVILVPMSMREQLYPSALALCGAEIILYDPKFTPMYHSLCEVLQSRDFFLLKRDVFVEPAYSSVCAKLAQEYPHIDFNHAKQDRTKKYKFTRRISQLCIDTFYGSGSASNLHVKAKLLALIYFVDEFRSSLKEVMESTATFTMGLRTEICRKLLSNGKWINLLLLEIRENQKGKTLTNALVTNQVFREQLAIKLPCLLSAEQFIKRRSHYLTNYSRKPKSELNREDLAFVYEIKGDSHQDELIDICAMKARKFFGVVGYDEFNFEDGLHFMVTNTQALTFGSIETFRLLRAKITSLGSDLLKPRLDISQAASNVLLTLFYHHYLLHRKPEIDAEEGRADQFCKIGVDL